MHRQRPALIQEIRANLYVLESFIDPSIDTSHDHVSMMDKFCFFQHRQDHSDMPFPTGTRVHEDAIRTKQIEIRQEERRLFKDLSISKYLLGVFQRTECQCGMWTEPEDEFITELPLVFVKNLVKGQFARQQARIEQITEEQLRLLLG